MFSDLEWLVFGSPLYWILTLVKFFFDQQVNPNCQYPENSFVGVFEFSSEFTNVGGINAPKKISCLGSDGKWRPQLVKGNTVVN